jgi:hypothetical protein
MHISFDRHTTLSLGMWFHTSSPICPVNRNHPRPTDIRGATNSLITMTLGDIAKSERSPPLQNVDSSQPPREMCRFIGYVPFRGKVWESDGSKSGFACIPFTLGIRYSRPSNLRRCCPARRNTLERKLNDAYPEGWGSTEEYF